MTTPDKEPRTMHDTLTGDRLTEALAEHAPLQLASAPTDDGSRKRITYVVHNAEFVVTHGDHVVRTTTDPCQAAYVYSVIV